MISPPGLMLKRPGIFFPVFFLSLICGSVTCQPLWPGTGSAALGGCFITGHGFSCTSENQAGLGFIEQSSLTLQHSRPYLLREIGNSSLTGQFRTGSGALGISIASMGLSGFRQSSVWLSYGLNLGPGISAGAGIHFWNSTIPEQIIFAPGISFALGVQIRLNDHWKLGGGLFHPAEWNDLPILSVQSRMEMIAGFSWSFLETGHIYSEIHIQQNNGLMLCNGLDWTINRRTILRTGIRTRPFTFSWGISMEFPRWIIESAIQYRTDTGISPYTSFTHAW